MEVESKHVNVENSTVGIDIIESIDLSPFSPRTLFGGSGEKIDYVAWDFAGQLEYSTLHPVFATIDDSICISSPMILIYPTLFLLLLSFKS